MDISMILGLAIAGSFVMLSGNKKEAKKSPGNKPSGTEFVVRIADGNAVVDPKA